MIKLLPEIISNKIAAGEVIERPASVVKELVENSIDAGSSKITIKVEKAGQSLIRVSDNGIGMDEHDAGLSLERHATSKIYTDEDLFSIKSLGFRGEALPSIASVSRVKLVTRAESSDSGTEIIIEGGKIIKKSEIGAPTGTMIVVRDIFFNTPARRKFLKTIQTELSHIVDYISNTALGWPLIHFCFYHNNREIKNWPSVQNPLDRAADVLGKNLYSSLFPVELKNDFVKITGWIASPEVARKTSRCPIYVNGRTVRDRAIQHAVFEGYRGRLMKGQFPIAVIFLKVPFDQVDVNVHPAKHEVRFVHQSKIYGAVVSAVRSALAPLDRSPWEAKNIIDNSQDIGIKEKNNFPFGETNKKELNQTIVPDTFNTKFGKDINRSASDLVESNPKSFVLKEDFKDNCPSEDFKNICISNENLQQAVKFSDLTPLGQLYNTYILCQSNNGLLMIDQHAAHERILFEQIKASFEGNPLSVQKLLIPETIELNYNEADIIKKLIPKLASIGIDIASFGGNTFIINSIPNILSGRKIHSLIFEIIEKTAQTGFAFGLEIVMNECIMLMACHAAIRAGQPMNNLEIKTLLHQLDACKHPSQCPHGRPTCIHWSITELEKRFKRK
ncbi:DNA mismatch repair protein MutL [Candidatus Magnetomoraceae bacterium gMMP-1]